MTLLEVFDILAWNRLEFFHSPGGQTRWQGSDSLQVVPPIGLGQRLVVLHQQLPTVKFFARESSRFDW